MTTTLATLRTMVRQRLGLQSTDGRLTDASLTQSINSALNKMATEFNWPWLLTHEEFSTVALQNEYDPPADWVKTMWLKIDNYNFSLTSRQRQDLIQFDTSVGIPGSFAIWEQKIWLSPAPDTNAYTVQHSYLRKENTLTADGDTVLCPDQYIDIVVIYTAIFESRRMKDSGLEDQLLTDKKEWIRNIAKLIPEVDVLPRIRTRSDFPYGN